MIWSASDGLRPFSIFSVKQNSKLILIKLLNNSFSKISCDISLSCSRSSMHKLLNDLDSASAANASSAVDELLVYSLNSSFQISDDDFPIKSDLLI